MEGALVTIKTPYKKTTFLAGEPMDHVIGACMYLKPNK